MRFIYDQIDLAFFQELETQYERDLVNYMYPTDSKNIITRLINMLTYPARNTGKKYKVTKKTLTVFKKLETKLKKPIEYIMFRVIYNTGIMYTVRYVKYGSITIMKKVITSPNKQISQALHNITKNLKKQGSKTTLETRLQSELYNAYIKSTKSYAVKRKQDMLALANNAN